MKVGKVIKKRPRIRLRVPRTVAPGETFTAEIHLHAKREVDIEYADVSLVGYEGWRYGESSATREVCRLGVRACDARTLTKGSNRLTVRCTIPEESPSSYSGAAAYVRYRIDVHVRLSWWPDAKASFEVKVRASDESVGEGVPRIYTTNTSGPKGTKPHVECSLATDAVAPGGEVVGNITLYNVEHNPYRDVMLSLIARERLLHSNGTHAGHADSRFTSRIAIEPRFDGESHSFRLKIPDAAIPARQHRTWRLEWLFEIEARARRNAMLRFPIRMLPRVVDPDPAVRLAAPTIGQARVATHWINVGERRGFTFANMGLQQSRKDLKIEVHRDHRGDEGTFLVARFTFPRLGLDIEGGLRRGLRRLALGVGLGGGDFEKQHWVKGREDRQVADFMHPLVAVLKPFALERLVDTQMEIAREGSGHSEQALEHFVLDVIAVADAWTKARDAMPAPMEMREARQSWATLGRRLEEGRFDAGDMRVRGKLDGAPVEVVTEWKGDTASLTRIALTPDDPVDAEHCFEVDDGEWKWGDLERLPGEARVLVDTLVGETRYLAVAEDRLTMELDAPQHDASELLKRLRKLAALAALLRTHAGPYR